MSRITRALLTLTLLALAAPASAAAAPALVPVGSFDSPVYVSAPPRDFSRLFVVEVGGRVRVVRDGVTLPTPFVDISGEVASGGERGMLSIAFPPDYESSGLFYLYLTAEPDGELQVREYHRSAGDPDRADPTTGRVVWRQAHDEAANHNGGQIEFGPDGLLWLATGDGGGQNNQFGHARDLSSQLGKLLRIDPRPGNAGTYTIPADNPYGTAVWAYGLRNPYRFSFDRVSGDLLIGDVGGGLREEIDWARRADGYARGSDFGWACREGTVTGPEQPPCTPADPYMPPIFDYAQTGPRAVTGGYLVRDPGLPTLSGRYVYADVYGGVVRSFVPASPRATDDKPAGLPRRDLLVSFGEDACGHLYVVSLNGTVERVQDGAPSTQCVLRNATTPEPPPPPPPAAGSQFPDRTSPRVRIRVARGGRVGRRATPRISLTPSENCRVVIRARVARANLKRVRTPLRAGRRTIVRLRPTHKGIKKIHRALRRHRRITMVVSVTAVDHAGNVGRVQRRLSLRRG